MSDKKEKITPPARPLLQRRKDTYSRLEHDKDIWIASGDSDGNPWLVPLSFWWDGKSLFITTFINNQTAKNILNSGKIRAALGHPRDVILIDANAYMLKLHEAKKCADAFTKKCGWDPRKAKGYHFFRVDPYHIEVWRELNEHTDRVLMDDGKWLA